MRFEKKYNYRFSSKKFYKDMKRESKGAKDWPNTIDGLEISDVHTIAARNGVYEHVGRVAKTKYWVYPEWCEKCI